MTDFSPQSSDVQKTSTTRENRDVYSSNYDTAGQALAAKTSGFETTFTVIALSSVGLQNSVVDIDVWMEEIGSGGGGTSDYHYYKLPFTRYLSNGTVQDNAYFDVTYNSPVVKGTNDVFVGPVTLKITYRNNVSATTYPKFFYKVSNRQVLA
jgi:hypothetical protein